MKVLEPLLRNLRDAFGGAYVIDKLISQAEVVIIDNRKYVKKKYGKEVGILKWLPPAIFLRSIYPFTLEPRERMRREIEFLSQSWGYLGVPRVLTYDESKLELVREYVEGDPLDYRSDTSPKLLGNALREIHLRGYALGDVKPTNFIVSKEGDIYVIDAEQATKTDDPSIKCWDLMATLLLASYSLITNLSKYRYFVRSLINEYLRDQRLVEVIREYTSHKFGGLTLLMPPLHLMIMFEEIAMIVT